jgi:hypothetical protein
MDARYRRALPGENKIAVLPNTTVPPALGLTPRFSFRD